MGPLRALSLAAPIAFTLQPLEGIVSSPSVRPASPA